MIWRAVSPTAVQQLLIDLASATVMPRGTRPPMPSGGAVERLNREQLGARAAQQLPTMGQTDVAAAASSSARGVQRSGDRPGGVSKSARRCGACRWSPTGLSRAVESTDEALDALLAAEPRLVELHYFKATAAVVAGALLTTERELRVFDERFPACARPRRCSGAEVLLALEEFDAAAAAFDVVLAADPDQPEALLHRMRAVSQLGDAARGEAAADRLVTLGTWYQGEAYYWRAWNRRALRRLGQAASDVETAKRVLFNAAVPKLAGFIAFDREQLDLALDGADDLARAQRRRLRGDSSRFRASPRTTRALGRRRRVVHGRPSGCTQGCPGRGAHPDGRRSGGCALGIPPRRARLQARAERDRATEHTREGLATFNAATAHVLAGHADHARPLACSGPGPGDSWAGQCERSCSTGSPRAGTKFRPT